MILVGRALRNFLLRFRSLPDRCSIRFARAARLERMARGELRRRGDIERLVRIGCQPIVLKGLVLRRPPYAIDHEHIDWRLG
jgi:hypothetical protein